MKMMIVVVVAVGVWYCGLVRQVMMKWLCSLWWVFGCAAFVVVGAATRQGERRKDGEEKDT